MFAERLNYGDEIRVIAPSHSLVTVRQDIIDNAVKFLSDKYTVTFSKHCRELDRFDSSSVESRIEDLHDAFSDKKVKAILTARGGFNANQLLDYIDFDLIKNNPKIFCGFSDISVLLNAIYAKTGLITYHGMMFGSFGYNEHLDYMNNMFLKCVGSSAPFFIEPSEIAKEYVNVNKGTCEGKILGGNLCTFNLLQGTDFMPDLTDTVLFLEDDNIMGDYFLPEFDRNLQSLLQAKNADKIKGIIFGRFEESCKMDIQAIKAIVSTKKLLKNIPVIFNVDFGHVPTFATFPIGGTTVIDAENDNPKIYIKEH